MLILLVIGVTFAFAIRTTIGQDVELIKLDTEDCLSLIEQEKPLADTFAEAVRRNEKIEQESLALLKRIPKKIVDSEVLASIRGTALSSKCTLHDFRPASTVEQKEFKTRSFELHIEGRVMNLFQFFQSMNQIPFVYQVVRFKIKESTIPNGPCQAEIELSVVFDHQPGPDQ